MLFKLFIRRALLVVYTLNLGNKKLVVNVLLNTGCTGYAFINRGITRVLCNRLDIEPQPFLKPKTITAFNDQPAEQITHGALPASRKIACMSWDEAQAIRPAISPE